MEKNYRRVAVTRTGYAVVPGAADGEAPPTPRTCPKATSTGSPWART